MDEREIRLRCIEAAARSPHPHPAGPVQAVLDAAERWYGWIVGQGPKAPLGLPKKGP